MKIVTYRKAEWRSWLSELGLKKCTGNLGKVHVALYGSEEYKHICIQGRFSVSYLPQCEHGKFIRNHNTGRDPKASLSLCDPVVFSLGWKGSYCKDQINNLQGRVHQEGLFLLLFFKKTFSGLGIPIGWNCQKHLHFYIQFREY